MSISNRKIDTKSLDLIEKSIQKVYTKSLHKKSTQKVYTKSLYLIEKSIWKV